MKNPLCTVVNHCTIMDNGSIVPHNTYYTSNSQLCYPHDIFDFNTVPTDNKTEFVSDVIQVMYTSLLICYLL